MTRKKQETNDKTLKLIVVVAIVFVYVTSMIIKIVNPNVEIDQNVVMLMGAVVGYLLKPTRIQKK